MLLERIFLLIEDFYIFRLIYFILWVFVLCVVRRFMKGDFILWIVIEVIRGFMIW